MNGPILADVDRRSLIDRLAAPDRQFWLDAAAREAALAAILDAADPAAAAAATARVDDALGALLRAAGFPFVPVPVRVFADTAAAFAAATGPQAPWPGAAARYDWAEGEIWIRRSWIENAVASRLAARLPGLLGRTLAAENLEDLLRIWLHKQVHTACRASRDGAARAAHDASYRTTPGYEEGLAHGLARHLLAAVGLAAPFLDAAPFGENCYLVFAEAWRLLAEALGVSAADLFAAFLAQPAPVTRVACRSAIETLRPDLDAPVLDALQAAADRIFAWASPAVGPGQTVATVRGTIAATWRTALAGPTAWPGPLGRVHRRRRRIA